MIACIAYVKPNGERGVIDCGSIRDLVWELRELRKARAKFKVRHY